MAGVEQIKVEDGEAGMRLDRWFKVHFPGLGFGHLQKLLRSGQVRVDGGRVKADSRVEPGQTIRIPPLDVDQKGAGPLTAKPSVTRTTAMCSGRCCFTKTPRFSCSTSRQGLPCRAARECRACRFHA